MIISSGTRGILRSYAHTQNGNTTRLRLKFFFEMGDTAMGATTVGTGGGWSSQFLGWGTNNVLVPLPTSWP